MNSFTQSESALVSLQVSGTSHREKGEWKGEVGGGKKGWVE